MFRFVPVREVVRVFEYLFAVAAERYGMQVHEALCMSNHFHALMTDVEGRLPDFMEYFDSLLARSLNAMRGVSGSVFEKEYSLVEVTDDQKGLEHAVYTLANPCASRSLGMDSRVGRKICSGRIRGCRGRVNGRGSRRWSGGRNS